jgi:hypothetical protein
MTTILSIAIITLTLVLYEISNLHKPTHFTKDQINGSNKQITVMSQPR